MTDRRLVGDGFSPNGDARHGGRDRAKAWDGPRRLATTLGRTNPSVPSLGSAGDAITEIESYRDVGYSVIRPWDGNDIRQVTPGNRRPTSRTETASHGHNRCGFFYGSTGKTMGDERLGIRWKCMQCGAFFWDETTLDELREMRNHGRLEFYRRSCVTCGRERAMRPDVIGQWDLFKRRRNDQTGTSSSSVHGRA